MKEERRKHPRAKLKWPVVAEAEERIIYGTTADVGIGGAFISCRAPLELGEIFDMVICDVSLVDCPLPLDSSLRIKAGVVRLKSYDTDDLRLHRGMGVRFLNISDAERALIATLISQSSMNT
jgi:hypothetical protein